jgi:pimeloyl-ACP methyl ester carboxylesterase
MDEALLNGGVEWSACVMGFALAGLQWGDVTAPRTALCLHGWMDNAMSFSALAPQVAKLGVWLGSGSQCSLSMPLLYVTIDAGYRVVAIDMPGHGRSQHMPAFCGNYSAEAYIRICAALLGESRSVFTPI